MYQYLVDDRTILAARLAELDLQWASKDFVAATMDRDERDLFLARLGHAMHGIEDFFAHSNFTEHAVLAAGGRAGMATALKRRAVRRVGEPPDDAVPAASDKVARRLRRYSPETETEAAGLGEPEPLVATGYFDGWDFLNSILHFGEELVRPLLHEWETQERPDAVVGSIRALIVQYGDDVIGDVLDMFELEPLDRPDSYERRIHQALDRLIEYVANERAAGEAHAVNACVSQARQDPVLAALSQDCVRTYLVPTVLWLTRTVKIVNVEWTFYKAIKSISEFTENPVKYLLKPLREDANLFLLKAFAAAVAELIGKDFLVKLNYALLTELQRLFRADRIGCHSVMAKDQETEPLFAEMFRCARHVDWFVADTLCRWSDREWVAATDDKARWVRWDALLGAYLRAPADSPTVRTRQVVWLDGTVLRRFAVEGDDDDFKTLHGKLANRVRAEALWIAGYEEFLQANLGELATSLYAASAVAGTAIDEALVAQIAAAAGMGSYDGRRLRLRPGLEVLLPITIPVRHDVTVHSSWFGDVLAMDDDTWRGASLTYERERLTMSSPEFQHYRLEFISGASSDGVRRQVSQFIGAGRTLRQNLEMAYNTPRGSGG